MRAGVFLRESAGGELNQSLESQLTEGDAYGNRNELVAQHQVCV